MTTRPPAHFNFATDVVERWSVQRANEPALWCVRNGLEQKLSFAQLSEELRRAAGFFAQLGIQRGDRVLLQLPRVPAWWISLLGLIRLGAVPIPGTILLTEKDLRYRAQRADVRAIITDLEGAPKAGELPLTYRILAGGDLLGWVS